MSASGRMEKIRMEQRLATARRGAQLLERKQHILADELERLQLQAARSRKDWEDQARTAATWLRRTAALDGRERIESASPGSPAQVELQWGGAMGVRYPEDARSVLPSPPPASGSSALSYAAEAHRRALEAAVRYAAVERALLLVAAELSTTRIRQRSVDNRLIPRIVEELQTIRRELDDQELQESLRLRWAAGRSRAPSGVGARTAGP